MECAKKKKTTLLFIGSHCRLRADLRQNGPCPSQAVVSGGASCDEKFGDVRVIVLSKFLPIQNFQFYEKLQLIKHFFKYFGKKAKFPTRSPMLVSSTSAFFVC